MKTNSFAPFGKMEQVLKTIHKNVIPIMPMALLPRSTDHDVDTYYSPLGIRGPDKILISRINRWEDAGDEPLFAIVLYRTNPDKSFSTRILRHIRRDGDHVRTCDENGAVFGPAHDSAARALIALLDSCPDEMEDIPIGAGARDIRHIIATRTEALEQGHLRLIGRHLYQPIADIPGGLALGRYVGRITWFSINHPLFGELAIANKASGKIEAALESRHNGWSVVRYGKVRKRRIRTLERAVHHLVKCCTEHPDNSLSGHETLGLVDFFRSIRDRTKGKESPEDAFGPMTWI